MNMTLRCEICKEYTIDDISNGYRAFGAFTSHLKEKHNTTRAMYVDMGYNIPDSIIDANRIYKKTRAKEKRRDPASIEKKNIKLLLQIGEYEYNRYPKCAICGCVARQLYKHLSNVHELTTSEYDAKYPNSPLALPEYFKYLKDTRTGENNPMYHNGSSEGSPFAKEFYMKKGFDEETAYSMATEKQKAVFEAKPDSSFTTKPEYYMEKFGVDRARALKLLTERQTTNSVEKLAERHGVTAAEAQVIRDEITRKWQNTLASKSDEELAEITRKKMVHGSVSNISMTLFDNLIKYCELDQTVVKYGDNEEILISRVKREGSNQDYTAYAFDFCYGKKVIEFNGDLFHANPTMYKADDLPLKILARNVNEARSNWTAVLGLRC